MKKIVLYLVVMTTCWFGALKVDAELERAAPVRVSGPDKYSVLFSGPALRVLSFGYDTALADYLFMKMIQYYAYQDDNHQPMTNIIVFLNAISDLDPRFAYSYEIAWNILINFDARPMDVRIKEGGKILRKGWKNNPDSWHLAQDLGFHDFFYEGNFEQAANMYDQAYKLRPSFPHYSMLAARLRTQAGKPELAMIALEQLYNDAKDPATKHAFDVQMKRIRTEITARQLEKVVSKFHSDNGRFPDSLDELVQKGYLSGIPQDNLGGVFKWNPETQRVESTSLPGGRVELHFSDDYLPPWKVENQDNGRFNVKN